MKKLITLILLMSSLPAFSNSYIVCAQKVDFDEYIETGKVVGFELALSSEDDDYSGALGTNWNLKLGSDDSEWLVSSKKVKARTLEQEGSIVVNISIENARSASGPVGTQYKLIGLFDDSPVLEKYTMGGFAGSLKVATFECVGSYD